MPAGATERGPAGSGRITAMKIAVTGASGLIGTPLVAALREDGHDVVRLVRGWASGPDQRPWDPAHHRLDPSHLADRDAVIHLAGAGVADHRWTRSYKRTVLDSRVAGDDRGGHRHGRRAGPDGAAPAPARSAGTATPATG